MSEENKIVEEIKKEEEEETEEEEDEEEKEDKNQLEKTKLYEIVVDDKDSLKGIKFNKEKCVKEGLLEESEDIKLYTNYKFISH